MKLSEIRATSSDEWERQERVALAAYDAQAWRSPSPEREEDAAYWYRWYQFSQRMGGFAWRRSIRRGEG